jgi:hypothetical protein
VFGKLIDSSNQNQITLLVQFSSASLLRRDFHFSLFVCLCFKKFASQQRSIPFDQKQAHVDFNCKLRQLILFILSNFWLIAWEGVCVCVCSSLIVS